MMEASEHSDANLAMSEQQQEVQKLDQQMKEDMIRDVREENKEQMSFNLGP